MIYVKSHYNRLDKKFFGKKIRYDYKRKIINYLTKFLKNNKIHLSREQKSYLKNNLISLFTIYRYFDIKTSEIYRLCIQLSMDYLNNDVKLTEKFINELIESIFALKMGYTQGKNI